MSYAFSLLLLIVIGFQCHHSYGNDNIALEFPVQNLNFIFPNFQLKHEHVSNWENIADFYIKTFDIDVNDSIIMKSYIQSQLLRRGYSNTTITNTSMTAFQIVSKMFINSLYQDYNYSMLMNLEKPKFNAFQSISIDNIMFDIQRFVTPTIESKGNIQNITIYQNKGANTGGTATLLILFEQIVSMGYSNAFLCNDSNAIHERCRNPSIDSLIITGEWCHGVLEDYNITKFNGKAIQYYLGFHQFSDTCRGHIPLAVSSYLHHLFGQRIASKYYLGSPMNHAILQYYNLLLHGQLPAIHKENLILFDNDYLDDYSPESDWYLQLPNNYVVVHVKDFTYSEVLVLLQRAKVVLDFALPGPERLVSESILLGAIPIISNRWNGASYIDFPSIPRVDPFNTSEIAKTIIHCIESYEELLEVVRPFYEYVISLPRRLDNTLDVILSSHSLHFEFTPTSLEDEYLMNLNILAILYLYPLANIIVYVVDVKWYWRHHYRFLSLMIQSGYLRNDLVDSETISDNITSISSIHIHSKYEYDTYAIPAIVNQNQNDAMILIRMYYYFIIDDMSISLFTNMIHSNTKLVSNIGDVIAEVSLQDLNQSIVNVVNIPNISYIKDLYCKTINDNQLEIESYLWKDYTSYLQMTSNDLCN